MNKEDISYKSAKILLDTQSVLVNAEQPFRYTSGNIGPVYVDVRRIMSFPDERTQLMDLAADLLKPLNIDFVAGGETAGIPFAAFIAERLNKPMLYVRKKPKGHGRTAQIEGCMDEENKEVLLVEDLMNYGTSQKIFIEALRNTGAIANNSFVILSYDIHEQVKKDMQDMNINVHFLVNWFNILETAKSENYFDPATIESAELFLLDAEEWNKQNADKVKTA